MKNNPKNKPWLYPEQATITRIDLADMKEREYNTSYEFLDESMLEECAFDELIKADDD